METNKKGFLFSVTEDQIQEGFTKFLIENKDISPDATLNAKISQISKQYYLFALCEGPYTVHWGATSIWEHQEEYVTHKDKVIFVDKYGNEYNYQADGTTPLVKNVEEKNYKTVLDDLKIIKRDINENYRRFIPADGTESSLSRWISDSLKKTSPSVRLSESAFSGTSVFEHKNPEKALVNADKGCRDSCYSQVVKSIPGNKYRDFSFDFKSDFKISEECYIPVYQVEYTYNKCRYKVWFSGLEKGVWFCEKVSDDSKVERFNKASKLSCKFFGIFFIVGMIFEIYVAVTENSRTLASNLILSSIAVVMMVASLAFLIASIVFNKIATNTAKRWGDVKGRLAEINGNQYLDLQTKEEQMEETVVAFTAEEAAISRRRRIGVLIPAICILLIVLAILLRNMMGIGYNGGVQDLEEASASYDNVQDLEGSSTGEIYRYDNTSIPHETADNPSGSSYKDNLSYEKQLFTVFLHSTYNGYEMSVTAEQGEAMPACDPPYGDSTVKFMGYFSGENGSGTQYYDENMNSVHNWDKTSDGELYAYWVKDYRITPENFQDYFEIRIIGQRIGDDVLTLDYKIVPKSNFDWNGVESSDTISATMRIDVTADLSQRGCDSSYDKQITIDFNLMKSDQYMYSGTEALTFPSTWGCYTTPTITQCSGSVEKIW